MTYLAIQNWRGYQHYRDRRPGWVKLHVTFKEDTADLSIVARCLAALLICVAATKDNRIPDEPKWLATELNMNVRDVSRGIAELINDGFLERVETAPQAGNPAESASSGASTSASSGASGDARRTRSRDALGEEENHRGENQALSVVETPTAPEPEPSDLDHKRERETQAANGAGQGTDINHGQDQAWDYGLEAEGMARVDPAEILRNL